MKYSILLVFLLMGIIYGQDEIKNNTDLCTAMIKPITDAVKSMVVSLPDYTEGFFLGQKTFTDRRIFNFSNITLAKGTNCTVTFYNNNSTLFINMTLSIHNSKYNFRCNGMACGGVAANNATLQMVNVTALMSINIAKPNTTLVLKDPITSNKQNEVVRMYQEGIGILGVNSSIIWNDITPICKPYQHDHND